MLPRPVNKHLGDYNAVNSNDMSIAASLLSWSRSQSNLWATVVMSSVWSTLPPIQTFWDIPEYLTLVPWSMFPSVGGRNRSNHNSGAAIIGEPHLSQKLAKPKTKSGNVYSKSAIDIDARKFLKATSCRPLILSCIGWVCNMSAVPDQNFKL